VPNETPLRRPRNWLDALVATALRWNDRLSRPVNPDTPDPASGTVAGRRDVGIARGKSPASTTSRSR